MAKLIHCRACNAQVSKNTDKCPQCGHPTPTGLTEQSVKTVIWVIGVFAIAYFLMDAGMFGGLPE